MRNLCTLIVCLVLGASLCWAAPLVERRRKVDRRLKSFTDRYALPSDVHSLTAKLPLTYGYRFTDDYGTIQSREEKTDPNGSKTGSYSFVDATGIYRRVDYVADHHGFRATVTTNEPGTVSVDPAHIRLLSENKNMGHGLLSHSKSMPQTEYSSNVPSRYNRSANYGDRNSYLPRTYEKLEITGLKTAKSPLFESKRKQLEQPKPFNNVNNYKGSSVTFSPVISSIIRDLDDPEPVDYGKSQNLDVDNFFAHPSVSPGSVFDHKVTSVGYTKKVPTRYPRRHRDFRTRANQKQAPKIHIPQGYEDHDLPLYRDK